MSARSGSKPPPIKRSIPIYGPQAESEGPSALRAYVTCPTEPRMRAISGHHPIATDNSLYPTQPPEGDLHSHSRVKIEPAETPISTIPDSTSPGTYSDRRTPTTDRCGPLEDAVQGAPARRDRRVFVRLDGVESGQVVSLAARIVMIGRETRADLHLTDVGVSRMHARLVERGNALWVEDLDSQNGTFINGERVRTRQLHEGDLVQFGPRASFRFSLMDGEQLSALQRLYDSSIHDALTGAYNRRYLEERLRMEIAFAVRHRTDCALIILDLDHFKQVNDKYGHGAGDTALKHVVQICTTSLRVEDVLARYGGEEFVVILRDIGLEGAIRAAERVRNNIKAKPVDLGRHQLAVTISAGCAALSECSRTMAESLLVLADRRLYAAKRHGRDRVVGRDA